MIHVESKRGISLYYFPDGRYSKDGEIDLFPDKTEQTWDGWVDKYNLWSPKTIQELIKKGEISIPEFPSLGEKPSGKSAQAFMKINFLTHRVYGGYPRYSDFGNGLWTLIPDREGGFVAQKDVPVPGGPWFYTLGMANEFIKHQENIELLNDYYMIE